MSTNVNKTQPLEVLKQQHVIATAVPVLSEAVSHAVVPTMP